MNKIQNICETLLFTLLILLIGSVIRMGVSIYLPSVPIIGKEFHLTSSMMGNTITVYFVVFSVFILVFGVVSDAYGRRPVVLGGMIFFIIGSFLCAISDGYAMLLIGRSVQAFGASMIPGTLMAMIRDVCSDKKMVFLVGWLSVLSALLLVASPVIGGFITHFFGWRENFWFLVVFTVLVFVTAFIKIPETHKDKKLINVRSFVKLIAEMSSSAKFILVLMPVISFYAFQGAFLSSSPYIVMKKYGFSPIEFGLSNIFIVVGIMIGRQLTMYLLDKRDELFIFKTGGILSLLLVALFTFMFFGFICGVWKFLIISGLFALVLGLISPVLMKSSITAFSSNSGVAAAFQGTLLLGASAVGSAFCFLLIRFMHMSVFKSFAILSIIFLFISSMTLFYLSNAVTE